MAKYPARTDQISTPGLYLIQHLGGEHEGLVTVMQRDEDGDWWSVGSDSYASGGWYSDQAIAVVGKVAIPSGAGLLPPGWE